MGTGDMESAFKRSLNDPTGFWGEAAEAVHWHKKWKRVLDNSRQPFYRWFAGGEVNTCYNALDLHIEEGRGDQPALIYDSAVTNSITTFTYRELRDKVAVFAGALARLGVGKGSGRNGSSLHPLYLRHHRATERGGSRQRRPSCGLEVDHEEHLWC